jgi:hypothetical protein
MAILNYLKVDQFLPKSLPNRRRDKATCPYGSRLTVQLSANSYNHLVGFILFTMNGSVLNFAYSIA